MFSCDISSLEQRLFSLPVRFGDLGLDLPTVSARTNDLSVWLSVMSIEKDNYDVTGQELRDALAVWYKKPLLCVPPRCDGCGVPSSLDHFLICRKGGLIV